MSRPDPFRPRGNPATVRAAIEKQQRQRPPVPAPAGDGFGMRFTPKGVEFIDADGNVVPPPAPPPDVVRRNQLAQATADAEAAFRRAVLDDWPSATSAYLAWTDARHREGGYVDVPLFADVVTQVLYSEVAGRNRKER